MILHFIVPQLLDELPDEVKNSIAVRRELFITGTCKTCKRTLPTSAELASFGKSMDTLGRDPVSEGLRKGILAAYYRHEDWCRGHESRLLAIAKRNGVGQGAVHWSIVSFDCDTRELVKEHEVPVGMDLNEIVREYERLVHQEPPA